ncbi:hypothetical protein HDU77_011445 [Chytriomyces hyalinus]|nr:hypothetical protein HDU77_011445 [Chytriomyces hyalinus]
MGPKATAPTASGTRKITDFFTRPSIPKNTDEIPATEESNNGPLFDPTDDNDDHLDDPPEDPIATIDPLLFDGKRELDNAEDSTPKKHKPMPADYSNSSKAILVEDDDDDMDVLMNTSFDFLFHTKRSSQDNPVASVDPSKSNPANKLRGGSARPNRTASTLGPSASDLNAILGSGVNKRANKHTHSLDSLLNDKMKREKQIQEALMIDNMLESENDLDENSNPEAVTLQVVSDLIDQTGVVSSPARTSKRKRAPPKTSNLSSCIGDEDEEVFEPEDADEKSTEAKASEYAAKQSKERLKELVMDGMKGIIDEKVLLFDDTETSIPTTIQLDYVAEDSDKVGTLIASSLSDPKNREDLLLSGALSNAIKSNWKFPASLSTWLFEIACFSDSEIMATAAARNLRSYLEHSSDYDNWIVTEDMLHTSLKAFGFSSTLFPGIQENEVTDFVKRTSRPKNDSTREATTSHFRALNFALCMELYTISIINRFSHYPMHTLESAFILCIKLSADKRIMKSTGDLLANCVSKIARVLATRDHDESQGDNGSLELSRSASFDTILKVLSQFVGTDPFWQSVVLCSPYSSLVGSLSAPGSALCPTRRGYLFISRLRKSLAIRCVLKAGKEGGFSKSSSETNDTDSRMEEATDCIDDSKAVHALNAVVSQYNVSPASAVYPKLSSRIQVLAVAIGGVEGVRENIQDAKSLMATLNSLHSNIPDARQLIAARSEAKEHIQNLKIWIELTLPESATRNGITDYFDKN